MELRRESKTGYIDLVIIYVEMIIELVEAGKVI